MLGVGVNVSNDVIFTRSFTIAVAKLNCSRNMRKDSFVPEKNHLQRLIQYLPPLAEGVAKESKMVLTCHF